MQDTITQLRTDLSLFQQESLLRIQRLESRLEALEKEAKSPESKKEQPSKTLLLQAPTRPQIIVFPPETQQNNLLKTTNPTKTQIPVVAATKQISSPSETTFITNNKTPIHREEKAPIVAAEYSSPASDADNFLWDLLSEFFTQVVGSFFINIFSKIRDLYLHYKQQEKLTVAFLTVSGIIASVLGFGFILQYSFNNFFNEVAKVATGFVFSLAIIFTGSRIIQRRDAFREYGSSLIGLGIILVYLCIYFASSFYKFITPSLGFVLIFGNTLAAYFLALKYETRIVSLISFLGGAFVPFILNTYGHSLEFYFCFLLLLCTSMIYLSQKIQWQTLVHISFLIATAILEISILQTTFTESLSFTIFLVHCFSYIYLYNSLFQHKRLKGKLAKEDLSIIAGSVSLLLLNTFYLLRTSEYTGYLYLGNALFFLSVGIYPSPQTKPKIRALLLGIAGSFMALAIPTLFSFNRMPLFWLQEAFLLLVLGFIYKIVSVRREALVLATIAMAQSFFHLRPISENWNASWLEWFGNSGMMNFVLLGASLSTLLLIMHKFEQRLDSYERDIFKFLQEGIHFWILGFYLLFCYRLAPNFAFVFVAIAMPYFFYQAQKYQLPYTKFLGFACYAFLILQGCISAYNSIVFMDILTSQWQPFAFCLLLAHMLIPGILFLLANAYFVNKVEPIQPFSQQITTLNNEIISLWFLASYLFIVYSLSSTFFLLAGLVPIAFLFLRAEKYKLRITQYLGFSQYALFLLFVVRFCLQEFPAYPISLSNSSWQLNSFELLLIGTALLYLNRLFPQIYNYLQPFAKQLSWGNQELFSLWCVFSFLYASYYIYAPAMYILSVLAIPALLWRAKKKRLPLTQALAFVCYAITLWPLLQSVQATQSLSFRQQSVWGKVSFIEAFVLLWSLQWFLEKKLPQHNLLAFSKRLRLFFYGTLPLLFLPHMLKYHMAYVPLALWCSVAIATLLTKFVKERVLQNELSLLSLLASVASIFANLVYAGKDFTWLPLLTTLVGLIVLNTIRFSNIQQKEKSLAIASLVLGRTNLMYPGFAIWSLIYLFSQSFASSFFATSLYTLLLFLLRNRLLYTFAIPALCYRISQGLVTAASISFVLENTIFGNDFGILSSVLGIVSFVFFSFSVFANRKDMGSILEGDDFRREELYGYHILSFLMYTNITQLLTGLWLGPLTTILLVVHAVCILFSHAAKNYKQIQTIAVSLFVLAFSKIFFYDLRDFQLIEKVIAFTIIGMLLLVSAYFMQKRQAR
ncbi:MAG: DUF2339 domain-containing protein [Spirochaetota bacterium]